MSKQWPKIFKTVQKHADNLITPQLKDQLKKAQESVASSVSSASSRLGVKSNKASRPPSRTSESGEKKTTSPYEESERWQTRASAQSVVVFEKEKTFFEKKWSDLLNRAQRSTAYSKFVSARKEVTSKASQSPVVQKVVTAHTQAKDRMEELQEEYETTQNPIVWKIRDAQDWALGETEEGMALAAVQKMMPDFDVTTMHEELDEVIIPRVVDAYRRGELPFLRQISESNATHSFVSSVQARQTQKLYWDPFVIDHHPCEFLKADLEGKQPRLYYSVMYEHLHCVRDDKGEIVEGSESDIERVAYIVAVRPDSELSAEVEGFQWRLVEFGHHNVELLG